MPTLLLMEKSFKSGEPSKAQDLQDFLDQLKQSLQKAGPGNVDVELEGDPNDPLWQDLIDKVNKLLGPGHIKFFGPDQRKSC